MPFSKSRCICIPRNFRSRREKICRERVGKKTVGNLIGLNDEVINPAASLAWKAHNFPSEPFLRKKFKRLSVVVFAFRGSMLPDDWFGQPPFGETKIDASKFPSLISLNDGGDAAVNGSFLRRFNTVLDQSSLAREVKDAIAKEKQVVFAGYSSAGPIAILATLYFLENLEPNQIHPRCLTFGSPLVGDRIFGHALRREGWSDYFTHFVMKYDIIPRIMLSPRDYVVLQILDYFKSEFDGERINPPPSGFYLTVMENASSVASHDACNLMGCRNPSLDIIKSFIELSPYRPSGTYIFCTGNVNGNENGNGNMVVVRNPAAVLQILFHCAELGQELDDAAKVEKRSLGEHLSYVIELQKCLRKHDVVDLDGGPAPATAKLNDLGLSPQAMLCLQAAEEFEKRRLRNLDQIRKCKEKIEVELGNLRNYKEKNPDRRVGYYDAFKLQNEDDDFHANVSRLELAGYWDEIKEMLKEFELPDDFEKKPEFIDLGTEYRRLVEPLDIANFYRHSKDKETGAYVISRGARPKRYRFIQRWLEHAEKKPFGSRSESCFWAEVEQLGIDIKKEGYLPEIKERIQQVEKNLISWIEDRSLDDDVLLENSTFVGWWRDLPPQHKSESDRIDDLILQKAAGV